MVDADDATRRVALPAERDARLDRDRGPRPTAAAPSRGTRASCSSKSSQHGIETTRDVRRRATARPRARGAPRCRSRSRSRRARRRRAATACTPPRRTPSAARDLRRGRASAASAGSARARRARPAARARSATPSPSRSRRPGGRTRGSGSPAAPCGARPAGASARPRRRAIESCVHTQAVREPHQRRQPHGGAHVVGEDQEGRAVRPQHRRVERDPVHDRAHRVLADPEGDVAAGVGRREDARRPRTRSSSTRRDRPRRRPSSA